jgi:hypothetical protein
MREYRPSYLERLGLVQSLFLDNVREVLLQLAQLCIHFLLSERMIDEQTDRDATPVTPS